MSRFHGNYAIKVCLASFFTLFALGSGFAGLKFAALHKKATLAGGAKAGQQQGEGDTGAYTARTNADGSAGTQSGTNGTTPASQPAKSGSANTNKTGASTSSSTSAGSTSSSGSTGGTSSAASGGSSGGSTSGSSGGGGTTTVVTLHYASGTNYNQTLAISLGFNVMDITGSTSNPSTTVGLVNGLPSGTKALVWLGNLDNAPTAPCPSPGFTDAQFQAVVNALAGNSKVYGYYISDEPHPAICPNAASDIKARADYIHGKAASQKAFIIVLDGSNQCGTNLGCEYGALKPSVTDVDLIGLDPYPCHYSGTTPVPCDNTKITTSYNTAIAAGIPASQIVPVFQTFGQYGRTDGKTVYYRLPTSTELTDMLNTWNALIPNPVMDYSYTFGVQCSSSCVAPQTLANTPDLQPVITLHNQ